MTPKLKTLYTLYEADLLRLVPSIERGFLCPICLRVYVQSENIAENISIEHIIPKKLGGSVTTLTCRQCNNTAGTKLDCHLVQRVQVEGKKKPIDADVEFCGTAFRGEVHLPNSTGDAIKLYGRPKQSNPQEINRFGQLLSEGVWDGQDLKLNLKLGYAQIPSLAALVRSAYLLMFRLFGYRYVFDTSAAVIRKTIAEPLVETDALKGVSWRVDFSPPTETAVTIITEPNELRSFMIFFTLDRSQDHVAGILLPPPSAGAEFYGTLENSGNKRTCKLSYLGSGINEEFFPFGDVWQHVITDGH